MIDFPVIGIVGLQASGKTEVASKISDLGAFRVRMGNRVWNEVEKRGLELSGDSVGKVANELREEEGKDAIAKRCIPIIKEKGNKNEPVVVDGIRGIAEVEAFEDEFGENFVLIWVKASEKERYNRIKNRGREDDISDFDSFKEKEERELGWGLEEAMKTADYKILNEGSLDDLRRKTKEVLDEIRDDYGARSKSRDKPE